ncbi:MAG: HAD-IIIA family hydrolase [Dehalococcoidia bacterium]
MRSALFLDLGGTLVQLDGDTVHLDAAGHIEILPGVARKLLTAGYDVVLVVTNQSGLERGTVTWGQVRSWIDQLNEACGGVITDWWASPRLDSDFRKPLPGMVTALADKHFVDLTRSLFVGDAESDRACAEAAGVRFEWARDFFAASAD